jgi:hypothetical protein
MNRWPLRSTAPMALLLALGLVALIGAMVTPATTITETTPDFDPRSAGPAPAPIVTVTHEGTGLAVTLLVIAVAAVAGAITLGVLRRRAR